jgi:hypothetical protein
MRRVVLALAGALLCVCTSLVLSPTAVADPATCQQYDSHGICVVAVEAAEDDRGTAAPPGATTPGGAAVCTVSPSGTVIPCQDGRAWWVQDMQCYAEAMAQQPPKDSPIWGGRTDGAIYSTEEDLCSSSTSPSRASAAWRMCRP